MSFVLRIHGVWLAKNCSKIQSRFIFNWLNERSASKSALTSTSEINTNIHPSPFIGNAPHGPDGLGSEKMPKFSDVDCKEGFKEQMNEMMNNPQVQNNHHNVGCAVAQPKKVKLSESEKLEKNLMNEMRKVFKS